MAAVLLAEDPEDPRSEMARDVAALRPYVLRLAEILRLERLLDP